MTKPKDSAENGARGGVAAIKARRSMILAERSKGGSPAAVHPVTAGVVVHPLMDEEAELVADEEAVLVTDVLAQVRAFERGDHAEVAGLLFKAFEGRAGVSLVNDRGELWCYSRNEGLWRLISEEEVTRLVALLAGTSIRSSEGEATKCFKGSSTNASGVWKFLRSAPKGEHGPGFFDQAPEGVAVANGFLVIEDGAVTARPHDWRHRVRDRIPIAYDPKADAPRWTRSLAEWFEADPDAGEKIAFLGEFVGACLFGLATRYQRCAVLLGEGANGKSVFIEVVSELFHKGGVTAIGPHDFSDERMGAGLDRSRLNAVTEIADRAILASEGFKAAVSGDPMTRRRAYGTEFTFKPRAGHLFSANKLPPVADTTNGFWRRLVLVSFNRRFEGAGRDPTLRAALMRELPGVLAWAAEGAARLVTTGRYTEPASSKTALADWRRESNPVELWLDERCERTGWTDAMTLFQSYQGWAQNNGFKSMSIREWGSRMKALVEWKKSDRNKYAVQVRVQ